MQTFIMLTQVSPEVLRSPHMIEVLERQAMTAVRAECPDVEWGASYAVLGPYDYVDVFRAPDMATATKVATLVRVAGHARTEVWGRDGMAGVQDDGSSTARGGRVGHCGRLTSIITA